ncbi:6-phosphogluconolactonase [Hyphococcus formosus]|uniref:6-phosphogluconolactonase n=1 Tax=Hyphococcus formosus TaxID=3143534 RepID=UPI00398A8BFA
MDNKIEIISFESRQQMAERVADLVEVHLSRALLERKTAQLAASGGSTPAGLYKTLAERDVAWDRVMVPLVDERWVAPGEPGSNETFVRKMLQQNKAQKAQIVGLWSDSASSSDGVDVAAEKLNDAGAELDVAILGMGNDGHTASWFPHAEGLETALSEEDGAIVAAVKAKESEVTGSHLDRLTMTLGHVKRARCVCLLITGDEKKATLQRAIERGPIEEMPVRAILNARPDIWICWAP